MKPRASIPLFYSSYRKQKSWKSYDGRSWVDVGSSTSRLGRDTWDAFHKGDRMAVKEVFGVVVRPLADVAGSRIE